MTEQPHGAAFVEPGAVPQREALMPGNVWAWVCCQGQVAAELYDGSKGCQGEAQSVCDDLKKELA